MPSTHPLWQLTITRFREFLREPEAVFWVFAFPVLLACALGLAFRSQGQPDVLAGVLSGDGAGEMERSLTSAGGMRVRVMDRYEADIALRHGAIHVLVIPGDPVTYEFDPSRPESRVARYVVDERIQNAGGGQRAVQATDRPVTVPGSRYIDWVVPGLLGMNIMGTGMWSVAFSVVQARGRKLLKRLMATPMRRTHYLLSHMLSRLLFLVLEVTALLGFARLVFGIPMNGSLFTLAGFCLLGALTFSGLGLLVASRAKTVEGVSGLMNLVMVPMWIFSGVFFASENFPDLMQPFISLLPLTALNEALRGVMIDGTGFAGVMKQWGILLTWTVASFGAALRLFRWQ
ncbi:MAG TPA: ABC transporter permease [Vicinamibacterales bacterium]|jgi:ABC-type multidrug transport system permease subunit|nr:ABC transporter permease [Vicinamibacterales bacterium]